MTKPRQHKWPPYVISAVLFLDGLFHLLWATGLTWPAGDARSLSVGLLGIDVPFRPALLIGLATTVWAGAAVVLVRARRGRGGLVGRLTQSGTALFTVAVALRSLLGCWWLFTPNSLPTSFYWLNLLLYTPLCLMLSILGVHLLGPTDSAPKQRRLRRLLSVRAAAVTTPTLVFLTLLVAAFGYTPPVQSQYSPSGQLAPIPSRYLETSLARFHYIREGIGSPIVLLSPGSAWLRAWLPQFHALAATHTVYAVDLPGQGFTQLRDPSFTFDLAGMTRAIGTFLDAAGLDSVALAGNSWSGGWALAYAQVQPGRVSSLALLAPSGLAEADPLLWELLKLPLVGRALTHVGAASQEMMRSGLRSLFVHQDVLTPALVEAMWAPNTFPDNVRANYELEQNLDWRQTQRGLPDTRVPTLIMWGRQDQVLPSTQAAQFGRLMPQAQVRVLDGCGHALTLDCPGQVTSLMQSFWHD
jgi:pimeloyl-ACP methyl ester carboxylesterase